MQPMNHYSQVKKEKTKPRWNNAAKSMNNYAKFTVKMNKLLKLKKIKKLLSLPQQKV